MASTYTTNLYVEKPALGDQDGTWGTTVNSNMDLIDEVLAVCAEDAANHTGLAFYYLAGRIWDGTTLTSIAAGHVDLADDDTSYVEVDPKDGSVSANVTGWTQGHIPLWTVLTASGAIDTVTCGIPALSTGLARFADANTAGTAMIVTLTVTAAATDAGTATIYLGDPSGNTYYEVALVAGTTGEVATLLRAGSYTGWTASGSGNDVVFTSDLPLGVSVVYCEFSGGASGAGGSFALTQQGVTSVHSLTPLSTHAGAAIGPTGYGALSAQVPDSTAAGGNVRGTWAVDWQLTRSAATEVASGLRATVGGGSSNTASGIGATVGGGSGNTASDSRATVGGGDSNAASASRATVGGGDSNAASGDYATVGGGSSNTASGENATVAGGYGHTASGYSATVGGGDSNAASASRATVGGGSTNIADANYATVGGGYGNTASGDYSTMGGGEANTASGSRAMVGGGSTNTASGDYATVVGGYGHTASGENAMVGGGGDNTASGYSATVVGGYGASAYLYGQSAYANGYFAVVGDAQRSSLVASRQTTNATQSELYLDGSSARLVLPAGKTWYAKGYVVARQVGGTGGTVGDSYCKSFTALIKNISDAVTLVGEVTYLDDQHDTNADWLLTVDADDTNNSLRIRVTGAADKTINWVARVELVEVA